jgi:hypothetical protein
MTERTHARRPTQDRRAFRTPIGIMVTAETLASGVRLYTPIVASWSRMQRDRQAA